MWSEEKREIPGYAGVEGSGIEPEGGLGKVYISA